MRFLLHLRRGGIGVRFGWWRLLRDVDEDIGLAVATRATYKRLELTLEQLSSIPGYGT